jgi:hypothetical protein
MCSSTTSSAALLDVIPESCSYLSDQRSVGLLRLSDGLLMFSDWQATPRVSACNRRSRCVRSGRPISASDPTVTPPRSPAPVPSAAPLSVASSRPLPHALSTPIKQFATACVADWRLHRLSSHSPRNLVSRRRVPSACEQLPYHRNRRSRLRQFPHGSRKRDPRPALRGNPRARSFAY